MEPQYIFGTVRQSGAMIENLKTKGAEHTDLHGYIETVRQYPSETITDRCRILDKYQTEEDGEGNCYDWYLIDQHYRYVDKTPPVATAQTRIEAQSTYTAMMTDTLLKEENANVV